MHVTAVLERGADEGYAVTAVFLLRAFNFLRGQERRHSLFCRPLSSSCSICLGFKRAKLLGLLDVNRGMVLTFFQLPLSLRRGRQHSAAAVINVCGGWLVGMASGQQRGTNMSAAAAGAFLGLAWRTQDRFFITGPLPPENNPES